MQKNGPKPLDTAQKATVLHTYLQLPKLCRLPIIIFIEHFNENLQGMMVLGAKGTLWVQDRDAEVLRRRGKQQPMAPRLLPGRCTREAAMNLNRQKTRNSVRDAPWAHTVGLCFDHRLAGVQGWWVDVWQGRSHDASDV